jgi:methionyl-tRNA formyltransferase
VFTRLNSVFMGTPAFAVPVLRRLAAISEVRLVVTQPDRPVGRGRKLTPPPVKLAAAELGLPVEQPAVVKGRRFAARIADHAPDVVVTAAFGRILGPALLETPRFGCLNVHASLLPAYRGAAPINHAILAGERQTGVSIMRMAEGLDTGPIHRATALPIDPDETAGELTERLAELGAETLAQVLGELGEREPVPQDEARASWAPMLAKADGEIDWRRPARSLHDQVRGLNPWPGAFSFLDGEPLKVHRSALLETAAGAAEPGTVTAHSAVGLDVACGDGVLRLLELQLPGKKRLDARSFHAGTRLAEGVVLGGG